MKHIKCFTCMYYDFRPFTLHYNARLCMKTNTFAVNSYRVDGKCGPTFKYFKDSNLNSKLAYGIPPKCTLNNIRKV